MPRNFVRTIKGPPTKQDLIKRIKSVVSSVNALNMRSIHRRRMAKIPRFWKKPWYRQRQKMVYKNYQLAFIIASLSYIEYDFDRSELHHINKWCIASKHIWRYFKRSADLFRLAGSALINAESVLRNYTLRRTLRRLVRRGVDLNGKTVKSLSHQTFKQLTKYDWLNGYQDMLVKRYPNLVFTFNGVCTINKHPLRIV